MLKKNCHRVLGSQKSKLTPLELVSKQLVQSSPPLYKDRVKRCAQIITNIYLNFES